VGKLKQGIFAGLFGGVALVTHVAAEQLTVTVTGPQGAGQPDMVVFAEPLDQPVPDSQVTEPLLIAQQGKAFVPYISVIQRDAPVRFVNQDGITHHIYSISDNNRFSFRIAAGKSQQIIAGAGERDGLAAVAMGCNIHDWMSGYMLVLDTPYYAKTDGQGQVILTVADAGRYRVNIWHPQLQTPDHRMRQELSVTGDMNLSLQLADPLAALPEQAGEDDFEFLEDY